TDFWQKLAAHIAETNPAFKGMTPRQVFEKRVADIVPMKCEQEPEDIGAAAVFLASDEARYITGQALMVGGGCALWSTCRDRFAVRAEAVPARAGGRALPAQLRRHGPRNPPALQVPDRRPSEVVDEPPGQARLLARGAPTPQVEPNRPAVTPHEHVRNHLARQ